MKSRVTTLSIFFALFVLFTLTSAVHAQSDPVPQKSATGDDSWRATVSFYGWFPGTHGTVGVPDHEVGVHASFSDAFHYLKGVVPIAVDVQKGRFVMPVDFFWLKLGDNKAIPFNALGQTNVDFHLTQSIFNPKIGIRLVDREKFKMDALTGIRYWHLGQEFTIYPANITPSQTVNWVDGLGGARFILPMGERAAVTINGDAGGGGAHLDYQVVGLLTLNLTRHLVAGAGWRYLDVDYSGNHAAVFDATESGLLLGLGFEFGGKPAVPPAASCNVTPSSVMPGEPVNAKISTQNFNPKHTVNYSWSGNTGATGTSDGVTIDTRSLAPGNYSLTATATDAKLKKNNLASCSGSFTVQEPPKHPPTASCSIAPGTVKAGDPATLTVTAISPDRRSLTYAYRSSTGQISGAGSSASIDTTAAAPGSTLTAAATVSDDRGLTATCEATLSVLTAPVTVQEVSTVGECKFVDKKKPWRVDNECKAVLDDISLKLQREPNGSIFVVGYEEEKEVVTIEQLGSHRAINIKKYLVEGEGKASVDAARITPVKGKAKSKSAKIYFVPQGATFAAEETETIDETVIKGQPRNSPVPAKKKDAAPAGN